MQETETMRKSHRQTKFFLFKGFFLFPIFVDFVFGLGLLTEE
jgi:hypothetical protein